MMESQGVNRSFDIMKIMQREGKPWIMVYVLAPVFLLFFLQVSPRPWSVATSLVRARQSQIDHHSRSAAIYLAIPSEFYSWRSDLWELKGSNELTSGDAAQALLSFKHVANQSELSQEATISLGDAYLQDNNPVQAIQTWEAHRTRYGPSEGIFSRLSRAYESAGDTQAVMRILLDWATLKPNDGNVLYRLGLYQAVYAPESALPILLGAAEANQGVSASARLVRAALILGQNENNPAYQLVLVGRALGKLAEWRIAEEAFIKACQQDPGYAEAWAFLGEAYQQNGKDGASAIQHAQELAPDSLVVQVLQALHWRQAGKPDLALASLHAIAAKEPQNGIWQVELGNTFAQMGDLPAALTSYQNAVQIEPENPVFWRALAAFSLRFNVSLQEVGLEAARKAVVLSPGDPQNLDFLAKMMMVFNDDVSAKRFLEKALQLRPDFAPAYLHMGLLLLENEDKEGAYQMLVKAAWFGAGTPEGLQAQNLLDKSFPGETKSQ
jgi:tetratricopeptide (TPR) repeat protein